MVGVQTKKNKIVLCDYSFRRDIENRLFMAELTEFEVEVLKEVLHHSIKFTTFDLAESVGSHVNSVIPVVDKISKTGLLMRQNDAIFVDKEMRKYFELESMKFEEDFEPNLDFLQGMLNKVPISVLPNWYSIPRSSDNIFQSLIEKYFATPRIYEKYLAELVYDEPILQDIAHDVFSSEILEVPASEIRKKYALSKEKFQEYMLLLEYHFVVCINFVHRNNTWEEVVTPFHEWKEYLNFTKRTTVKPIEDLTKIKRDLTQDFGVVLDMQAILKSLSKPTIKYPNNSTECKKISEQILSKIRHKDHPEVKDSDPCYIETLIEKLIKLGLIETTSGIISKTSKAETFLKDSIQNQAMILYRNTLQNLMKNPSTSLEGVEKNYREVEKSLRRISTAGWVLFDDFLQGITNAVGNSEAPTLKRIRKKWQYAIPQYSPEEKGFIEKMIFESFLHAGFCAIGSYNNMRCFAVTPFGRMALGG